MRRSHQTARRKSVAEEYGCSCDGVAPGDVAAYEYGQEAPLAVLVTFCDVFAVRWYWLVEGRGASAQPPVAGTGLLARRHGEGGYGMGTPTPP